jgi:hypothetical protein
MEGRRRDLLPGNDDRQAPSATSRQARGDGLVVVGDRDHVQPAARCLLSQFPGGENTIPGKRVDVEVGGQDGIAVHLQGRAPRTGSIEAPKRQGPGNGDQGERANRHGMRSATSRGQSCTAHAM